MRSSITLDKVDLVCAENLKYKPTGNDSVFIDHSNTIDFSGIWLDISGYLITQWQKIVKEQAVSWFNNLGRTKN